MFFSGSKRRNEQGGEFIAICDKHSTCVKTSGTKSDQYVTFVAISGISVASTPLSLYAILLSHRRRFFVICGTFVAPTPFLSLYAVLFSQQRRLCRYMQYISRIDAVLVATHGELNSFLIQNPFFDMMFTFVSRCFMVVVVFLSVILAYVVQIVIVRISKNTA